MITISTIGYEKAALDDFVATLRAAGVSILLDVRAIAASRRRGFSKKALMKTLEEAGITYVHVKALGDPKEGRNAARAGQHDRFRRIYQDHLKTGEARNGLEEAEKLIVSAPTCLLCYERDPAVCHRTLIADALADRLDVKIVNLGVRQGIAARNGNARPREFAGIGQGAPTCWAAAR